MKGFIEITTDSKVKIFVAVSSIWSFTVERNGLVGIYVDKSSTYKHFEVLDTLEEIVLKIEAAEQPEVEVRS